MNTNYINDMKTQILDISRQNNIGQLTPFLEKRLEDQIASGVFKSEDAVVSEGNRVIEILASYRRVNGVKTVVLGMSGGVDSALTAALFKKAGYRVIGVTMPIHQNPEETFRGKDACEAIGIEHLHMDLSDLYDATLKAEAVIDSDLISETKGSRELIRCGNIRARLRMITLYNLASKFGGFVASTDNLSELAAGFWTLHGDVGDVSPIQHFNKSWEVPILAKNFGVPEHTWRATPTDGLGISNGDEAQLGVSYLEFDIIMNCLYVTAKKKYAFDLESFYSPMSDIDIEKCKSVFNRMKATWFKRRNPFVFDCDKEFSGYLNKIKAIDEHYNVPMVFLPSK